MTDAQRFRHRKRMLRRMHEISREVATWPAYQKNVEVPHHLHEARRLERTP